MALHPLNGFAKKEKFKKSEITREVGGSRSHSDFLGGNELMVLHPLIILIASNSPEYMLSLPRPNKVLCQFLQISFHITAMYHQTPVIKDKQLKTTH